MTTTSTKVTYNGTRQTQPTSQTTYAYSWWDSAQQATITFDADTGSGSNPVYASTFGYDVNGRLSFVNIKDGRPRNVTFVTDAQGQVLTRREADSLATGDPFSQYYYFNGQRIGETTNDAAFDQRSYSAAVIRRTAPPSSGASLPFQGGVSNFAIPGAGFDYGYEGLRPDTVDTRGQAWTVRDGDTLQGIAAAAWGDASLWYLIAEHNGLTGASVLSPGQLLTVPAKVANVHNTSETFRPYDPNKAMGDLSPTQPRPPKKPGGCGVIGQVIAVAIAMVVSAYAGPVAGNLASQAFLIATGAQDDIDWKSVGITLITAGVAKGLENIPQVATAVNTISRFNPHVASAAYSATANVITQGVSVATGLQNKFSWTQVAVSAVGAFAGSVINSALPVPSLKPGTEGYKALKDWTATDHRNAFVGSMGTSFAAAGTQSLLDGTSFGDNLIATLPQVIGATIGNAIVGGMQAQASTRKPSAVNTSYSDQGLDLSGAQVDEFGNLFVMNGPDGKPRPLTDRIDPKSDPRRYWSTEYSAYDVKAGTIHGVAFRSAYGSLQDGSPNFGDEMSIRDFNFDGTATGSLSTEVLWDYNTNTPVWQLSMAGSDRSYIWRDSGGDGRVAALGLTVTDRPTQVDDIVVTGNRAPQSLFETIVDYTGAGLMGIINGALVQPVLGLAEMGGSAVNMAWDYGVSSFSPDSLARGRASLRNAERWGKVGDTVYGLAEFGYRYNTDYNGTFKAQLAAA